ncbi:hypothetical protein FOXYS1_6853 [Fusarium oxysporum]|uniref:Major facilitator superfamily (MFS) profile domain-containing protein n=1 Tax=Fusarium oxysporum TaxID=5507 RepID=A0A8H5EIX9_FUSOX|nr:hypothetical protein FOXYS1_6853 [Fusarium oxysporum]
MNDKYEEGGITAQEEVRREHNPAPTHGEASPERYPTLPSWSSPLSTSIWNQLSRLGDLPEWTFRGHKLQGATLNRAVNFIASCGFLMFGYDQGVFSALLTLDDFQRALPLMTPRASDNPICWLDYPTNNEPDLSMCTGTTNTQAAGVAIYQVGCFLGAVLILLYGELWGRKSSTFWGCVAMLIGTIMQAAANSYGLFVGGRVIAGIGNGMATSTIPTWQSECAPPEKRGLLVLISGCLIAGGITIAYWVDYGFYFLDGPIRWRFPVAFQCFFAIIVMWGLLYLPDSPRWLAMRDRADEARNVITRLLGEGDEKSAKVEIEIQAINEALHAQMRRGKFRYRELLTSGPSQNFRRTLIGIVAQCFNQICGINLVTYYATFLFENSLGFGARKARLVAAFLGTECLLASLFALPLVERTGRRSLMLFGVFGMMLSMAILAGTVSTGTVGTNGAPVLENRFGYTATAFLFIYYAFFAIGWLGTTWLYPAEITNLRIRIQANALSTCSNWLSNFLVVMITPPAFAHLGYKTYIIFAIVNAAIIPCIWAFFPEPRGRSLEEMDVIFASAHADGVNPVKRAKEMRHIEGRELEMELAKYFGSGSTEVAE